VKSYQTYTTHRTYWTHPIYSTYSALLTTDSQTYCRPGEPYGNYYYYHAIQVQVFREDIYSLESNSSINTYGYIYTYNFDPSDPYSNILSHDDNGGHNGQFKLIVFLQPGITYVLVVTTVFGNSTGAFSIIANGPASVTFTRILPHITSLQSSKRSKCSIACV
jgi:hypothetical protein